jgi:hypothetical protein
MTQMQQNVSQSNEELFIQYFSHQNAKIKLQQNRQHNTVTVYVEAQMLSSVCLLTAKCYIAVQDNQKALIILHRNIQTYPVQLSRQHSITCPTQHSITCPTHNTVSYVQGRMCQGKLYWLFVKRRQVVTEQETNTRQALT